jgi:hypothetical protein
MSTAWLCARELSSYGLHTPVVLMAALVKKLVCGVSAVALLLLVRHIVVGR